MGRLIVLAVLVAVMVSVGEAWVGADLSSPSRDQFFDALVPGYGDGAVGGELLFADVNSDGYDDLIMGAPDATVHGTAGAGAVTVVPGSPAGLVPADQVRWTVQRAGGQTEGEPRFGQAIVAGDFDGDGVEDLAVGAPGVDGGGVDRAGVVHVRYSSSPDFGASEDQRWHEGADGVPGRRDTDDRFGSELAAGDFDGDGFDDLVVRTRNAGADAMLILEGGPLGLGTAGARIVVETPSGLPVGALAFEAAATADLDQDGFDELLLGSPGGADDVGVVTLWRGSARGLDQASATRLFGPGGVNVGLTLDVMDLDDDGWLDVVASGANRLRIARGTEDGLVSSMSDHWPYHRGTCCWGSKGHFVPDFNPGEVVVGDFDGDRLGDIMVGRRWAGIYLRGADVLPTWGASIAYFGEGVRAVGDADGDGVDDVASYRVNDGRSDPATGDLLPFVSVRYSTRSLTCAGSPVTVFIARGDRPTSGDDVILGTRGDDRIFGRGGDDVICGRGGRDRLHGGRGDDRIYGGADDDRITGGLGRDHLDGGVGADRMRGGRGRDALHGGDDPDWLVGGPGSDAVHGERGADVLIGGRGADRLTGDRFEDVMRFGLAVDDVCDARGGDRTRDC